MKVNQSIEKRAQIMYLLILLHLRTPQAGFLFQSQT